MKIEKKIEGNKMMIILEGRLDTNTSPELESELNNLNGVENLVFDFERLEYISSARLRILLCCQKKMNTQGSMVIKNVNDEIKQIFNITGFNEILTIE